ncbi:alcohol dehydrogenase catalytic domain-containing protein [Paenibacillus oryzisoli]|uniref:alcohol dehydrogenase catalytic domain-containing protein n=1 Tax=Paenibacillus oryzisoli TaxID=1850517 RepID=UPI0019589DFA|nr:alcohol dehydrogenase catalytic domain-containing protein [Paenibacillus oryzisoli]
MELVDDKGPHTQVCAVMDGIGKVSNRRALIPEPNEGEVRVKVKWVGICGSDVEVFRGAREPEFISYPTRLGHEVAGVIDKVGKNMCGEHLRSMSAASRSQLKCFLKICHSSKAP